MVESRAELVNGPLPRRVHEKMRERLGRLSDDANDAATVAAISEWRAHRGVQRALPHTRDGRPTDFLFVERGQQERHPPPAWLPAGGLAEQAARLLHFGFAICDFGF